MESEEFLDFAPIKFVCIDDKEEQNRIIDVLMSVVDPEIGIDIINLGLVYEIHKEDNKLYIIMTLTALGCPLADVLSNEVKNEVLSIGDYSEVEVKIVYSPPWDHDRLSSFARMELGIE
ncbi:protein of unknown function DUF59 [Thermoanaerobacter ethanolicus JW 200]|uniref:metal-sulfur cluster assembly factor n=1 Tax=Thermoanaerobacter ethanolicus TaxID=1757 RepID=UPI000202E1B1|nr:protein of unknown function DUF59 [Thermoanaerobacter ethanolicus JW 200]